jgi:hypothetical protein
MTWADYLAWWQNPMNWWHIFVGAMLYGVGGLRGHYIGRKKGHEEGAKALYLEWLRQIRLLDGKAPFAPPPPTWKHGPNINPPPTGKPPKAPPSPPARKVHDSDFN